MPEVLLDQHSLGLRPFLEMAGVGVKDVTEILARGDGSKGVPGREAILEFVEANQALVLVTKDKALHNRAKAKKLRVIFVDESEVAAAEVLRQLSRR
jgi:rRNA-processing protein FCF1